MFPQETAARRRGGLPLCERPPRTRAAGPHQAQREQTRYADNRRDQAGHRAQEEQGALWRRCEGFRQLVRDEQVEGEEHPSGAALTSFVDLLGSQPLTR